MPQNIFWTASSRMRRVEIRRITAALRRDMLNIALIGDALFRQDHPRQDAGKEPWAVPLWIWMRRS